MCLKRDDSADLWLDMTVCVGCIHQPDKGNRSMINLTITECETGSINVKWAQVNDVFELSTIANAFDVGVNAVRDELVIDVKEIQQSTDGNE